MYKIKHARSADCVVAGYRLFKGRDDAVGSLHLQGDRFRHATVFMRWRPDKPAKDCRYDQLEVTAPFELARVFGA